VQIKSEHAVGYLKGQFQSLKGLRQQIKDETDHLCEIECIQTCIVIHTLVHDIEHGEEDSDWEEDAIADGLTSNSSSLDDDHCVPGAVQVHLESAGQQKQCKVKESLFSSELFN
jgi:hypothetical protein